ncbi:MAG: sodium:proton exchanger [Myxococcales bacterium]|nr:MAG: sodium:proton exchanger [Myxococcales bacterium]
MGHVPLLDELAIVAALAVFVTVVLSRLKLPTVAGLLAAGALLGPFGLRLVSSVHSIEVLAEVGVVLLLFSIGLEFSLARLRDIMRQVAVGGALQVGLTTLVVTGVAVLAGQSMGKGLFYGFAFALSSTAIVLRALAERRELDAPHGKFIVGTLIFQDLCVVPMVLIVPLLSASGAEAGAAAASIGWALAKATVVVIGTILVARFVVPKILGWVDASRSREVFLLAILTLCIGTAWLTSMVGLSLALGAFLGGMVVADTEYSHRAMGDILPLRDAFVSVFFVSLGMLFDVRVVATEPLLVGGLLAGFLLAKGLLATLAAMAMRFPSRVAWLAGVGLAQFGEFGFVLSRLAQTSGLVTDAEVRPLLAAGIASMFVTPLFVRAAPHITAGERLLAPLERLIGVRSIDEADESRKLENHVIIIGFGVAGRLTARTLQAAGAPFVVLELNADNVRKGKELGLPVYYGDATSEEALGHAHLREARQVVLLMNDQQAAQRVVDMLRRVAPHVPVLMRTRYLAEREGLMKMGARDVVAEEVEGAVEVIARLLRNIELPRNVIESSIQGIRAETQTSERKQTLPRAQLGDVKALSELKIESVLVREQSQAAGASPVSMQLRSTTGVLVVGVRRGEQLLQNPDPQASFEAGDIVYFVGTSSEIRAALPLFDGA